MRRRRALLVAGFLGICVVIGIWAVMRPQAPVSAPSVSKEAEVDHNAEMIQQAFTVQQAIETYAREHQGTVPADAPAFDREIVQAGYLPNNRLPASPWGGQQPAMLPVTGVMRGDLGPAQVEGEIRSPNTLGALCYEAVSRTEYRLYGIGRGKAGQAAVIIQLGSPPQRR